MRCNLQILKKHFLVPVVFLPFTALVAVSCEEELPKFLIIGAQKSGTGAFYKILCQHPDVVDRKGEVHFFDIHFQEGVDWYKSQFPKASQKGSTRGDKSPYYLFHPLVPKRAYELLPKAKLIALLRNPVDRAYSQYRMNLRNGIERLSFADAIKAEPERLAGEVEEIIRTGLTPQFSNHRQFSYLSRGLYAPQLKRWLSYYPLEQMMIISFDDFSKYPEKIMGQVLEFLELSEYHNFDFQQGVVNSYPPMDLTTRQKISIYFRPYNEELERLIDRKLSWD